MRKIKPSALWETDHIMGGAFYDHPDTFEGVPGSEYLKLLETREDTLIFRDVDCDGDMWFRVFVIGKSDKESVSKSLNNWRHPKFALWDSRTQEWRRVNFDKISPDFFQHKGIEYARSKLRNRPDTDSNLLARCSRDLLPGLNHG